MTSPDSLPKGSLEELFRHHLLESEAAATPPFPHVWEQIDNTLLLKENEQYRRRLRAYRWAMAASLLLAVLAGGGWWHSQLGRSPALAIAAAPRPGAAEAAAMAGRAAASAATYAATAHRLPASTAPAFTFSTPAIDQTATPSLLSQPISFASGVQQADQPALATTAGSRTTRSRRLGLSRLSEPGQGAALSAAALAYMPTTALGGALATMAATADQPVDFANSLATTDVASTATLASTSQLQARLANLRLPAADALPALVRTTAVLPTIEPKPTRPWQLQVAYAASVFDPNIDFEKNPSSYDASLGPGTVATTRDAAAEYRHHLRPGLGQRLSVWATRRLGIGRWSLRTGLELAENSAGSASSVAFVGQQVSTLNNFMQVQPNRLQATSYRYRSASVPVEVQYTSPLRRGFSLYGRAGALVTALLNVRSSVAGEPEATHVYSWQSADSPYRQVMTNVRGGVGMRYQPDSHLWAVSLGPVAEAGVLSLNLDPTQSFWMQRRPYSFGLEAGVEFSSLLRPALLVAP